MKPRLRWIALAVVVAAVGAVDLFFRSDPKAAAPETPLAVLTIAVTTSQHESWPVTVLASGAIAAWQEAVVSAQTAGLRVAVIHADVGDRVRQGQLLAELDSAGTQAELRRLEANLAQARASLAQAKSNAARARIAQQGNAISEQQFNDYLIAEQTAEAGADAAQAQVDAQRIVLGHTRITAVDAGVIASRSALLGKTATAGEEMFRLIRGNRLEWRAELDARQMALVRPGQTVRISLPTGEQLAGTVRVAAPGLSSDTARGVVYVALPTKGNAQAGMFADGRIEVAMEEAQTLPQSAVVMQDGYSYVFEVGADERVARRAVRVGRRQGERSEILAGLTAGARIVASGGAFLADGDRVTIAATPPASKGKS